MQKNAIKMGASKVIIKDLKNVFVREYIYPMFRCNTLYEGSYLLGTAIARPLIAKPKWKLQRAVKQNSCLMEQLERK